MKKLIVALLVLLTLTVGVNMNKAFAEHEYQPGPFGVIKKDLE